MNPSPPPAVSHPLRRWMRPSEPFETLCGVPAAVALTAARYCSDPPVPAPVPLDQLCAAAIAMDPDAQLGGLAGCGDDGSPWVLVDHIDIPSDRSPALLRRDLAGIGEPCDLFLARSGTRWRLLWWDGNRRPTQVRR